MSHVQPEARRDVVEALTATSAIDFDRIGRVLSRYGARAAVTGHAVGVILGKHLIDLCIPLDFHELLRGVNVRTAARGPAQD